MDFYIYPAYIVYRVIRKSSKYENWKIKKKDEIFCYLIQFWDLCISLIIHLQRIHIKNDWVKI